MAMEYTMLVSGVATDSSQTFDDFLALGGGGIIADTHPLYGLYDKYSGTTIDKSCSDRSLLDAYRAFKNALDTQYGHTWVAYASTDAIQGPLCETLDVESTSIKMVMGVHLMPGFSYNPLGIHRSAIGSYHDQENGLNFKNISLDFQRVVAGLVGKVDPTINFLVVRPLGKMGKILTESGIPCSLSPGESLSSKLPHMHIASIHGQIEQLNDFVLIDPAEGKKYDIPNSHWFVQNPFYGHYGDRQKLHAFPLVIARRTDLAL